MSTQQTLFLSEQVPPFELHTSWLSSITTNFERTLSLKYTTNSFRIGSCTPSPPVTFRPKLSRRILNYGTV